MNKILCIGDSLTYGMLMNGEIQSHPYTLFLTGYVTNEGVCGETTGQIVFRLSELLKTQTFDYVILLAGSNDVGYGLSPKKIISNLQFGYDLINESGAKLITVTIPESRWVSKDKDKVNEWIRSYEKCYSLFDLNRFIDTEKHLSIDLNRDGYELFGKQLSLIF